ncbi:phosphatase PAP2 family protein [Chitinibacter bivalviorum]|uniref:Phosphatase PAP2 family protein n=1 Tax=Chitinibacter bivalviorum TaxID=2739434 RepID=A0A7H9BJ70_9NEIS|nr:phosphatase PAP2 family protein [Chitinibacter bivalviorum]QLG88519.1 phosphatase PAP2 family protein [Chitinibacter bivalviorum]
MHFHYSRSLIALLACSASLLLLLLNYPSLAGIDLALGQWAYAQSSLGIKLSILLGILGGGVGSLVIATGLAVILYFRFQDRIAAWLIFGGVALSWSLNAIFKGILGRPRPEFEHLVHTTGNSLPSGHAMAAVTLGALVWLVFSRHLPQFRTIGLVLAALWIALSGAARLVLGVHYFSDILAGYLMACIVVIALGLIYDQLIYDRLSTTTAAKSRR